MCISNINYFQVAARVTPDEAEKDEWFVVKVIHVDKDAKEYVYVIISSVSFSEKLLMRFNAVIRQL